MARLPAIRAAAARIADPRGLDVAQRAALVANAVPVLVVSIAMHSTETAAPQFGMEFAHQLATSEAEPWKSARERMVTVVLPCTNPDGLDHVCEWYRGIVGTEHETASMPKLYQYYTGHDNNRDWFALTQAETRLVTKLLYEDWHPQVYWDVHQQGQLGERMFVPPFRDPLNPNLDPTIMASINLLGTRALHDMTREGYSGVATGVTYDQWWNGGNRNVPVRHNIVGLLTEAASVNFASPVYLERAKLKAPGGRGEYAPGVNFPMPWPGGWWRLRDIIDYELAFGRSLVRSLASEPRVFVENALQAAERSIAKGREEAPRAWVLPSDNDDRGASRRLVDTLLRGGVELQVARAKFSADGREYPAGSVVIFRDHPYGQHVKDLFETQRYPEGDAPYDVAGWTLPLLFGVRAVECVERPTVEVERLRKAEEVDVAFRGSARVDVSVLESDTWRVVFERLARGEKLYFVEQEARFVSEAKDGARLLERLPRVGLYAPYTGSMDEGWMRWVFDTWKLPYVTVRNEGLRAGELAKWIDVLVIPDVSAGTLDQGRALGSAPSELVRGLGPQGAVAIEEFVRSGGRLVTVGAASQWAIDLLELPLVNVTKDKAKDGEGAFNCPGSVLRAIPKSHALTRGLPESVSVFFSDSAAWKLEPRPDARV
ncbi:MAG: M14 family metallopeptidase, partial [Planctomycetota bacterium]